MKVTLVAQTVFHPANPGPYIQHPGFVKWADELAEFAGRACYQSWNRPHEKTATNKGYLANILDHKHFSVLEHASATFYIEGVSRSFTHELVRHRHLSFSQLSQRYVDESKSRLIVPPDLADETALAELHEETRYWYSRFVRRLLDRGKSRKEARQAARAVLMNATETKIVVTGNHRAWREMIQKRTAVDENGKPLADLEYHAVATELLRQLKDLAPNTYQDME